jgi:hypothetical protein
MESMCRHRNAGTPFLASGIVFLAVAMGTGQQSSAAIGIAMVAAGIAFRRRHGR